MSTNAKIDQLAGRIKIAAGKAIGNRNLVHEGTVQHRVAKTRIAAKNAAVKVSDMVKNFRKKSR